MSDCSVVSFCKDMGWCESPESCVWECALECGNDAPLAQSDRASASEAEGQRFESSAERSQSTVVDNLRLIRSCEGTVRRLRRWVLCRGCDYHHWVDAGTGRRDRCSVCHGSVFDQGRPWSLAKLAGY